MAERGATNGSGPLIIIGGGEDRKGEKVILQEVAKRLDGGKLVLATVASHQPDGYFQMYQEAFGALGINDLVEIYVNERAEALKPEMAALFDGASGVFFTGGDQLRICSQLGDTPVEERVREIHERGGVVAGTSAGASAMSDTMLVRGASRETHRIGDLTLAPGLGLVRDVIIDQHFAERGRIGRLLGAVSQNPRELGLGIDEDTAVVMEGKRFDVIGAGGVYVVDGGGVTRSNIAEAEADFALSIHDVRLHLLCAGDSYNLGTRRPSGSNAPRR